MPYEEVRKQRLQENRKRMQELGLSKLSESLSKSINATSNGKIGKSRLPKEIMIDVRRSSRIATCPKPDYREDSFQLPIARRSYSRSSLLPTRYASDVERIKSINKAQRICEELKTDNPYFVKSMLQSHVSGCFWLGLPHRFCKNHLPKKDERMVLEDENGGRWETVYLALRTGLSGGWRGFAMDHGLEDGDAIVFELIEPNTFQVHIVRALEIDTDCEADKDESQALIAEQQGMGTQSEADKSVSRRGLKQKNTDNKNSRKNHKKKQRLMNKN